MHGIFLPGLNIGGSRAEVILSRIERLFCKDNSSADYT